MLSERLVRLVAADAPDYVSPDTVRLAVEQVRNHKELWFADANHWGQIILMGPGLTIVCGPGNRLDVDRRG